MNQTKHEKFIIFLASLACIALTVESILLDWEFWVPPIIIIGTTFIWVMALAGKPSFKLRKPYYLVYAMLALFYHGVHETSFYEVAVVVALVMVAYSFFDHFYMINLMLIEYVVILLVQLYLALKVNGVQFDSFDITRIALHVSFVLLIYFCCRRMINDRIEAETSLESKDERIEDYESDMEDFLSNISHELRTPVNVVNGMSELLIKKGVEEESLAIKNAGIRLANQIEDIQDYTECKRNKVLLEEEDYMCTSLINDVVTSFRLADNDNNLELIVDLDPKAPTMMHGDIKKLHKIFRHLLENAVKFTKHGGIYVRMYTEAKDYGVNLIIEMQDTGIGMDMKDVISVSEGLYQANKKRNRSTGGIGLGLFIVYGFAHKMGGFVKLESEKGTGTTVRVTVPQAVVDSKPCLVLPAQFKGDILFHVKSDKYKTPRVRDFYRNMASNLAVGLHAPLYSAESLKEIEKLSKKLDVRYIFMGQEEYEQNPTYFDDLSKTDMVVAVSAVDGFKTSPGSRVIVMPKPLYAYPVIKILNEGRDVRSIEYEHSSQKPVFKGVKALVVDDEPMNLVVAAGLFREYEMIIDTAVSGKEAIAKYRKEDYDLIFMDHMMPEMDGVEAMKLLKKAATENGKSIPVVALTANAVSGAKEMFINEGFDGFIAKPIDISDFERVMMRVLPAYSVKGGEKA